MRAVARISISIAKHPHQTPNCTQALSFLPNSYLVRVVRSVGEMDWSLRWARVEIAAAATAAKMQSPFFRRTEKYAIGQAVVKYVLFVRAANRARCHAFKAICGHLEANIWCTTAPYLFTLISILLARRVRSAELTPRLK